MAPKGEFRWGLRLAIILTAILVSNNNYFLLFTFVHCDHDHHLELKIQRQHVAANNNHHHQQIGQPGQQSATPDSLTMKLTHIQEPNSSFSSRRAAEASRIDRVGDQTLLRRDNHKIVISSLELISARERLGATNKTRQPINGSADIERLREHTQEGQLSSSSRGPTFARPTERTKRMAVTSRSRTPRIQLAQRPPKGAITTSTTSTTTTTPSNKAESEKKEEADEESEVEFGGSDDYVEIKQASSPATSTAKTTTVVAELDAEDGAVEEEEEEEEEGVERTTTTTTTTRRPTTRKPTRKSRPKTTAKADESSKKTGAKVAKTTKTPESESESSQKFAETKEGSKQNETESSDHVLKHHLKKKPLVLLPFIKPKNISVCTPEAYLEFPRDFIGDKWRSRGFVIIHVLIVCYMFYALAVVCERYFMPSLEEFAQRLQISEDVAGATLMSAGSSAPELFTAILGVFVAKGDVGTGAIVGSAVFNILFVIGVCAFVSSTSAQLQWWPVLRDSIYYTFTVLMLIIIIYDERITALESGAMILLYGLYIIIMAYNEQIKAYVTRSLLNYPLTAKLISTSSVQIDGLDEVFGGGLTNSSSRQHEYEMSQVKTVEDDSIFMAALLVIIKHKRLFRPTIRFQSTARYIIIKRQHRMQQQRSTTQEVNYFGPEETGNRGRDKIEGSSSPAQRAKMEAYARSTTMSKQKFSIVSKDDYEFWHRPPEEGENYFLWLARIPANYLLHYTIPDCTLYPDKYIITFVVSILWTAVFSYVMVWMVTLIGYTLGIPDSVMGVTFLAAGTSVPDCYSSIHAARNGMADMAVSNSIGSNVFDILIGLSVPWFIQSTIYPGVVATINSRGVIYSVILLFLSLIVTIYLLNKYEWSLQPRLGLALLIAYGLFIILTCMLEFNLLGHVNPPPCPPPIGAP